MMNGYLLSLHQDGLIRMAHIGPGGSLMDALEVPRQYHARVACTLGRSVPETFPLSVLAHRAPYNR